MFEAMSRIIAIGDIHGCSTALRALLDAIQPTPQDTIIGLGDFVDRGPDTRGVLDTMLDLEQRCQLVALRGNHEIMMMHSFEDYLQAPMWVQCGGLETLDSYGGAPENVPVEHFRFLRNTRRFYETDDYFFVHANYNPRLSLNEQPDELLFWEHISRTMPDAHRCGKTAVVGHTSQKEGEILDAGHLICLDTFCWGGQWLTAMEMPTRTVWQANEQGELRGESG